MSLASSISIRNCKDFIFILNGLHVTDSIRERKSTFRTLQVLLVYPFLDTIKVIIVSTRPDAVRITLTYVANRADFYFFQLLF